MERSTINKKLELLKLARKLSNVAEACRLIGYSRDSFYRFKKLYENGGEDALQNISRRKPNLKNRVDGKIEIAVLGFALEKPECGQRRCSDELKKQTVSVSPSTVRNIWLRHNIETFEKRVNASKQSSMLPSSEIFPRKKETLNQD